MAAKGELINSENRIANRTDENNSYVIEQSSKEILPGWRSLEPW